MSDNEDLLVVATFSLPSEAAVAASVLDGEGIDSLVDKPFVAGVRPDWIFGTQRKDDGVRLLVRAEDLERARSLLVEMADDPEQNSEE